MNTLPRAITAQIFASIESYAALRRRSVDLWKLRPEVFQALRRASVRQLMDPAPLLLPPTSTLDEIGHAFATSDRDYLLIGTDDQTLTGIVTMTDLARAISMGTAPTTAVAEFMTKQPVTVSISDDPTVAATILREHTLKHVPVVAGRERRLVGVLHARRLMAHVYGARPALAAA